MADAIPPPAAVPDEAQSSDPAPKTESTPPKKRGMERAKQAAVPSSIIGALLAAVTAIYQANDTSLEKKTYETLSKSVIESQTEIRALNERMAVFEQALLVAALNGHGTSASTAAAAPVEPEQPTGAAPRAPARVRPRTHAPARGALVPAEFPVDVQMDRDQVMMDMPADSAPVMVEHQQTKVEEVAEILGRKIEVSDGEVTVEPAPAPSTKKAAPLPNWNELSK